MMDPNRIRHSNRHLSVRELLDLETHQEWPDVSPEEMTLMVETMLVNGPMPRITVRRHLDDTVTFGSGMRFVAALRAFKLGDRLGTTVFMPEYSARTLAELPSFVQRRFHTRSVDMIEIEVGTPDEVAAVIMQALSIC